ncbi:single-stranded-DNA-specific exonuclease RecJ [Flavobacteriaceae bacterium]|jgi:single-stranded-DNA-specific exonuclease|nr:single-stranded-DNA-specific exonuclease RecJ [Flavobacteriaceae bacterium]
MRWTLKPKPEVTKVKHLKDQLQINDVLATLLVQRGIETYQNAKHFFRPSLEDLHDPFLMKDMEIAVSRIEKAITAGEHILVYGDYDVDGTSSVALMSTYLKTKTKTVATYIPDRYEEGYGVSYKGIDFAHDNDFSLIIALDCGVKAIDKVFYAKNKGIDFIICDHHRPGIQLPDAVAILDPKRQDCAYPYKELCGCGVGFKLIQALNLKGGNSIDALTSYLDLVVLAIGADIVPITGENRVLAYFGLQVVNSNPRPGIETILRQANKKNITITDLVFRVAPRINAAGRMKHGNYAVTLLSETNVILVNEYAAEIEQFNLDRKKTDKQITNEALQQIKDNKEEEKITTVVFNDTWHKGVIGIVASRLIETYYRPTIVFTKSGEFLAASARSIPGFDVYNALESCSQHIEQFGGHKYAAGLTIKPENYEAFKQAFENEVSRTINLACMTPEVKVDASIGLDQVDQKLWRILRQFAPFGPGNMSPIFMSGNLKDTGFGKCVGEDLKHLRMTLTQSGVITIPGIGFSLGNKLNIISNHKLFKAIYSVNENHWQGNTTLQLIIKDIKS